MKSGKTVHNNGKARAARKWQPSLYYIGRRELLACKAEHGGCYLVIVVEALEVAGAYADGAEGHGIAGVARGGEADAGSFVHQAEYGYGEGVEVGVERLLVLAVAQLESGRKLILQHLFLFGGDVNMGEQSEVLLKYLTHVVPGVNAAVAEHGLAAAAEGFLALALMVEKLKLRLVADGTVAESHAAGVVIGGDYDEGFVRVLEIEVVGHLERLVEVDDLLDGGTAVVGMQRVVYIAALHHHEEILGRVFLQVVEAGLRQQRQCESIVDGVNGVADVPYIVLIGVKKDSPAAADGGCAFGAAHYLHAVLLQEREYLVFLVAPHAAEAGTAQEFVAAARILAVYLIVHAAVGHMGVECARGGVVD